VRYGKWIEDSAPMKIYYRTTLKSIISLDANPIFKKNDNSIMKFISITFFIIVFLKS
jgi:hypothetical protein